MHDALLGMVCVAEPFVADWSEWLEALAADGRAASFERHGTRAWFPAEQIEVVRMLNTTFAAFDALLDSRRRP